MLPFNYIDLSKFSDSYLDQGDTSKKFGQVKSWIVIARVFAHTDGGMVCRFSKTSCRVLSSLHWNVFGREANSLLIKVSRYREFTFQFTFRA